MNATATPIRTLWALALLAATPGFAQMSSSADPAPPVVIASAAAPEVAGPGESDSLPDAPVPVTSAMTDEYGWTLPAPGPLLPPCPSLMTRDTPPCLINPFRRFLDGPTPVPLTAAQKGYLAMRNFVDPANLITITGSAAFTVALNADTGYGPGFRGFARDTGYSFLQDATGEFFGTFLIPSLTHEDPHYHREPHAPVPHRILHAFSRTVIAQSDTGRNMPNYATLLTYPIWAETSNLYVPGIQTDGASTVKRIATGLATDPINNLITEFLPDVARRINIRVVFIQRLVNMMSAGNAGMGEAPL